ncbi:hypothetical protein EQG49_03420 [Periweissella cryptocerci]|uniref:Uncharacterized protein n=1 Tax=Periweissella cryptocerci TaxID=2506420 RepID=A0A4P6YSH8_9LACO|nr:DnaD domain protein [Periweissella cryptocerci]QBO35573.1 hypothetical protein EQG49_03420 [Periweissella cryptocerci]
MSGEARQLNPMSGFILSEAAYLSDFDRQVLTYLYQPIIGPNAMALFNTFWTLLDEQPRLANRRRHSDLMNLVSLSPQAIVEARGRLEAVDLIHTWHNSDALGEFYVYEMHAPLLPDQFFSDELMSVLLIDAVGSQAYKTLQAKFRLRRLLDFKGEDISQSMLDVFHLSSAAFNQAADLMDENVSRQVSAQTNQAIFSDTTDSHFDFELLLDTLQSTGLTAAQLAPYRNLIISENMVYGVNELALANIIRQTMNFDTHEINELALKQAVSDMYKTQRQTTAKAEVEQVPATPSEKTETPTTTALPATVQKIVQEAKDLSPVEFLNSIKTARHGFVTANEEKTITDLVEHNVLPMEVINILTYYVLVGMKNDNLTRTYYNSIANSLGQHKIMTAEAALADIAKFNEERAAKSKSRANNGNYRRTPRKVETTPTYEKTAEQQKTPAEIAAQKAAAEARMERLRASRAQNNEN